MSASVELRLDRSSVAPTRPSASAARAGIRLAVRDRDVGEHRPCKQVHVLGNNRKEHTKFPHVVRANIATQDPHPFTRRLVEPDEKARHCGLTGARGAHQRDVLASACREGHVRENRHPGLVGKAHVVEGNRFIARSRRPARLRRERGRHDIGLVEKFEESSPHRTSRSGVSYIVAKADSRARKIAGCTA